MKKILAIILTFFLAIAFAGCVDYSEPVNPNPGKPGTPSGQQPVNPGQNNETKKFTVKLTYLGAPFKLGEDEKINARWTGNDATFYVAEFNTEGVAEIEGLDGDYKVTLSAVPAGYTYDANIYSVTNDDRDVNIRLYRITETTGSGSDYYTNIINLTTTGVFRTTLSNPSQVVFYQYAPQQSGTYSVQSIIDVTANEINPILDVYIGTRQFKPSVPSWTQDDGSTQSSYTKNFLYSIELTSDMVGNVYAFGIRAESINGAAFPVKIDFIIERNGEFTGSDIEYSPIAPTESFKQTPEYSSDEYGFIYAGVDNNKILDESLYKINPDDGYYHRYDSETDAYGPILYAKLSKDNMVFSTLSGTGFLDGQLKLNCFSVEHQAYLNFYDFINSYAEYTNSDGVYAVTAELKNFLQSYSVGQRLFNDGNGYGEKDYRGRRLLDSAEDDQWLFACGFYKAK